MLLFMPATTVELIVVPVSYTHLQTGNAEFKVADLLRDQAMIPEVQRLAPHIHERYPQQAKALIERWMPETERYSNA